VDSFTPAGGKLTLFDGLILTIGINGCEPGGNE